MILVNTVIIWGFQINLNIQLNTLILKTIVRSVSRIFSIGTDESFYYQGQKHTILNLIREHILPPDLIHQGHIPLVPHGSTRL